MTVNVTAVSFCTLSPFLIPTILSRVLRSQTPISKSSEKFKARHR